MNIDPRPTDDDLQAFADNELDPSRRAAVARHLEQSSEAAAKVEAMIVQTAALRTAAGPLLDGTVPHHLSVDRLFERERRSAPRFRAPPRVSWPRAIAALACMFAIGTASGWGLRARIDASGIRPLVEEAADAYAVYEPDRVRPVEISAANRDDLMTWVSARLRRPIVAPPAIAAYQLLGGRLLATSRGPAAMFMYDDGRGRRIVMLVCPLSVHGTAPITDSSPRDLSGISWSEQGVGYSLVGSLPRAELHELGAVVRGQTTAQGT